MHVCKCSSCNPLRSYVSSHRSPFRLFTFLKTLWLYAYTLLCLLHCMQSSLRPLWQEIIFHFIFMTLHQMFNQLINCCLALSFVTLLSWRWWRQKAPQPGDESLSYITGGGGAGKSKPWKYHLKNRRESSHHSSRIAQHKNIHPLTNSSLWIHIPAYISTHQQNNTPNQSNPKSNHVQLYLLHPYQEHHHTFTHYYAATWP